MLDGVYLFSEDGKCLLSFPVNGGTSISPVQFRSYIPATSSSNDRAQTIEVSSNQLLHRMQHGNLYIFIPFDTDVVPLMVEELSVRIVEIVESYLKARMTPVVVNEHRPDIVLILSEMLDTGIPRVTQPNIIRQLVYKDDFFSKLIGNTGLGASPQSAVGAASQGKAANASSISGQEIPDALVPWEVPWRRSQVRHAKEELFVDIIEHARLVFGPASNKRSHSLTSISSVIVSRPARVYLSGEVKLVSRLSGLPHVTISLSSELSALSPENTQLHPCVDLEKFESSGGHSLSFVPADGESVLARYKHEAREQGPVAADLRRLDKNGDGSFQVGISTSIDTQVDHVSGLVAYISFPPGTRIVKEISTTSGDFDVSNPQKCELRFPKTVPMGWNAVLHALALDEDDLPVSPLCVDVRYKLLGRVPSRTTVKGISITPQKFKSQSPAPFKGVRYQTIVDSYVVA